MTNNKRKQKSVATLLIVIAVVLALSIAGMSVYRKRQALDNQKISGEADNQLAFSTPSAQKKSLTMDEQDKSGPFTEFKTEGESVSGENIYLTAHTSDPEHGWLFIIDSKGNELWRSKDLGAYAYSFRQYRYQDGTIRYAYQQAEGIVPKSNGGIERTHVVLVDEEMNIINDNIVPLSYGTLGDDTYCENHDYIILGDNHYVLLTAVDIVPENLGYHVFNNIIQEQKDGKVIWQLETIDYPELYEASFLGNEYETYTDESGTCGDYVHINSLDYDKKTNAVVVSFRSLGLVSFDYTTKEINWIIGTKRNDIEGITEDKMPKFQHCARVMEDGSIILFDNSGCLEDYSRIQRLWIDNSKKRLVEYKEYLGNMPRSPFMGCIQLIDEESETYMISYGGNFTEMALEEFSFKTGKRNFKLTFDAGEDLYAFSVGPQEIRWAEN